MNNFPTWSILSSSEYSVATNGKVSKCEGVTQVWSHSGSQGMIYRVIKLSPSNAWCNVSFDLLLFRENASNPTGKERHPLTKVCLESRMYNSALNPSWDFRSLFLWIHRERMLFICLFGKKSCLIMDIREGDVKPLTHRSISSIMATLMIWSKTYLKVFSMYDLFFFYSYGVYIYGAQLFHLDQG